MSDIKYFVIENGVLKKYKGNDAEVVIPDGVTSIGYGAFYSCENLTTITIPNSVTSIGAWAFKYCRNLTTITIPDSVTSIGGSAFYGCSSLTAITIPDNVTSIGKNAFFSTSYYKNKSNWENGVLYIGNHLIKAKKNISGTYTIRNGTKTIADNAFESCESLTSITIPDSVTSIGEHAFEECTNLTTITMPDSVTSIGGSAFYGCSSLTAITIPDSVTSIGVCAFYGCSSLTAITIPDSVTSIGVCAFYGCSSLTAITIPDNVTSIGKNAFFSTSYYNNQSNWEKGVLHIGNHLIKAKNNISGTYTIRNGTKTIADNAFGECTKLTTITIPGSVTSIGNYAFSECDKLRVINLPQNITSFKGSSLEVILNVLLKTDLKEVVLKSFITQLSIEMLKDADLSRKIKTNKKLIIDNIIKNDDVEALAKLLNLYKTIKIDELNEYIEKAKDSVSVLAFLLDYKNKNYTIEKQEKHENDKLDKELGLKERTLAEWKKIYSFDVIDVNGAKATITGYKGLDLNVIIPSNIDKYKVVAIADYAFSTEAKGVRKDIKEIRRKIESIVIPESVVRIGNYAFAECENLTTITIPDSVRKIGEYSFSGCENLIAITIPDGVRSIGEYSFSKCKNLTIHAHAGSYAEEYAKENKIKFVAE